MHVVLVIAGTLLAAVYIAGYARRTVLSTTVLFLAVGLLCGSGLLPFIRVRADETFIRQCAGITLFIVLFTDGMRVSAGELRAHYSLPARALGIGMPVILLGTAAAAHALLELTWVNAFLVGAILSPSDPVLVESIVGREEVPERLRRLLNIESGLNDGLALPVVVALVAVSSGLRRSAWALAVEVVAGVVLGFGVAWAAIALERRSFTAADDYLKFLPVAIGMLVWGLAAALGVNAYLGAFTAGITIFSFHPDLKREFDAVGEYLVELVKLAAVFFVGVLLAREFQQRIAWPQAVFVLLALAVVRPVAIGLSLAGSALSWRQILVAGWFGPKGFSSVVYALLVLGSNVSQGQEVFHICGLTIAASIVAHSSSDVPIARWLVQHLPRVSQSGTG